MNGTELLSLAAKFSKIEHLYLKEYQGNIITKKIAVLSSFTTHHLVRVLNLFLYKEDIKAEIYEGGYDGITSEILNTTSNLYEFRPDILIILTHHLDIKDLPAIFSSTEEVNAWLQGKLNYYNNLWKLAMEMEHCQILQTSVVIPLYRQLGNLEANYLFSATNCLHLLNLELIRHRPPNVIFIDMDYIAAAFGKEKWFDDAGYFLSKQGFSLNAAGSVAHTIARMSAAISGKTKKCLVVDLDNTLWGGIIGDDGIEGINLNPNDPLGEAFLAFQRHLILLKERGIILSVCSKNNETIAKQPFVEHPDMRLRLNDFACFIANWEDKATNLKRAAQRLNIGLDSMVFFDDNPAEREIVRRFVPEVEVIEVPEDPALYVRALEKSAAFEWTQLSKEDITRSLSYVTDEKRKELQSQSIDYNSYLKSLEMTAEIGFTSPSELQRFTQLINKSNQFNLRTIRYTEASLEKLRLNKDEWSLFYVSLSDKFSHYGIISAVILQKIKGITFINTWVMSCRVLNRGVEILALNNICAIARAWKSEWLIGEYLPTKKNALVSTLLPDLGFETFETEGVHPSIPEARLFRLKPEIIPDSAHFINIK